MEIHSTYFGLRPSARMKTGNLPSMIAGCLLLAFTAISSAAPPDLTNGGVPVGGQNTNLGPTGMSGWVSSRAVTETLMPDDYDSVESRQILVTDVDLTVGSPAAAAGIQVDDVILGASGDGSAPVDFNSDARKSLALAIADAEARATPELKLKVWRISTVSTYTMTLQTMGAYGPDAPIADAKCDLIIANCRQALLNENAPGHFNMGTLLLMALDDPGSPDHAATKARIDAEIAAMLPDSATLAAMNAGADRGGGWERGHELIVLSEYYLTYGEHPNGGVFEGIEAHVNSIAKQTSVFGTMGHIYAFQRWPDDESTAMMGGYGAINSSAVPGMYGMLLAKQCNVINPALDDYLDRATTFYGSYAKRGAIPYGEHEPYPQALNNNGKSASAALALSLRPGKEEECRYYAKMAAASASEFESGHTGPFFSKLWSCLGASVAGDEAAKSYFAQVSWYYDLARRWDGSFAYNHIYYADKYDQFNTSVPYAMTYGLGLKRLYMTGRGRSAAGVLSAAELAEVLASGSLVSSSHDWTTRTKSELIGDLGDWCPLVQLRAAMALGAMTLTPPDMGTIHALASDPVGTSREGALRALKEIKDPASAPVLAAILTDSDPRLRYLAAEALSANPSKSGEMNALLAALAQAQRPVLPLDPQDPLQTDIASMGKVLFGTNLVSSGFVSSLNGVDRALLYPALRAIGSCATGAGRSSLNLAFSKLDQADVLALGDLLVDTAYHRALADPMNTDASVAAAMDTMGKYRIAEAIPVASRVIETGFSYQPERGIYKKLFDDLREYGGTNLNVAPDPEVLRICLDFIDRFSSNSNSADTAAQATLTVEAILNDHNPAPPSTLKSFDWIYTDATELTLPASQTQLHASVTDHAKGELTYTWRKVYGAGNVTFVPNGNAASKDTTVTFGNAPGNYLFEVAVIDSRGLTEVTDTVAMTLYETNGSLPANAPPLANAQSLTVPPHVPSPITLSGSDPESGPLLFKVNTLPAHGRLTGTAPDLIYTSETTFPTGTDNFTFEVTDNGGLTSSATVTINTDETLLVRHVYEPFDYPAGTILAGASGGSGMTGSWADGSGSSGEAYIYDEEGNPGGYPDWDGIVAGLPTNPTSGARYVGAAPGTDATFEAYRPLAQSAGQMAGPDGVLWMTAVWHFHYSGWGEHVGLALTTDSFRDRGKQLDTSGAFGSGAGDGIGVARLDARILHPTVFDGGAAVAQSEGNTLATGDYIIVLKMEFGAIDKVSAYAFPEGMFISEDFFDSYAASAAYAIDENTLNCLAFSQNRQKSAVDEIRIGTTFASVIGVGELPDDTTPPNPDPMGFSVSPTATSASTVTMTAATATDPSGVEYYFTCTVGGGNDSGWQESPTYTDTGLLPATLYSYTVKARDKSFVPNESAPSAEVSAATLLAGPAGQVITWGAPTSNLGPSDVSTNGTLVEAINGGPTSAGPYTVNGTTFTSYNFLSGAFGPNVNWADLAGDYGDGLLGTITGNSTSFVIGDRNASGANGGPNQLIAGHIYELQVFYAQKGAKRNMVLDDGNGNTVGLDGNLGNGQNVIGTFTSDGTLVTIGVTGFLNGSPSNSNLSAYQLRDITVISESSDYDTWAGIYTPADLTDPAADLDGDGLTNDEERIFGLDPTSGASANPISVPLNATAGTFSYTRRDNALTSLTYAIETSTDLQAWDDDVTATATQDDRGGPDANGIETVAVTLSATPVDGKLFVRVKAN